MTNVIIVLVLLVILGAATGYIVKEKKKGAACIGCPHAGNCGGQKNRGLEVEKEEKQCKSRCDCH